MVNFRLAVTYFQFLIQICFLVTICHSSSFWFISFCGHELWLWP